MAVGLGENERLGHLVLSVFVVAVGENLFHQCLAELTDNGANLARIHHRFVQIVLFVFGVFVHLLPTGFACGLVADIDVPTGLD